jgi:hypothetical protein
MSFEEFSEGFRAGFGAHEVYIANDHRYYKDLTEKKLSFTTAESEKRFTLIHLVGTHPAFTFGRNMEKVEPENGSELNQARAAFTITFEYLDQLKKMGLYEDSTIIVTADHGGKSEITDPPPYVSLFVKPSGSFGTPLAFNNAPLTFDSFRATVIKEAGGNSEKYGPTYFEVPENAVITRPYFTYYTPQGKTSEVVFEYEITDDVKDIKNWKFIRELDYKFRYRPWE